MNKKKIVEQLNELQEAIKWLEKEATPEKTHIFYWEHLGPIYRVLTSLKKDIK